jgi:hypothetical protein
MIVQTELDIERRILLKLTEDSLPTHAHTLPCTHIVVNEIASYKDVYSYKKHDRNVKSLIELEMNTFDVQNIKEVIKMVTNYGFDGIMFSKLEDNSKISDISRLINAFNRLPKPYDFSWDFYFHFNSNADVALKCLNKLKNNNVAFTGVIIDSSILKTLTDWGISESLIILSENTLDNIKYNKLAGVFVENESHASECYKELKHSIQYQTNNLDYPTSSFIKQLCCVNSVEDIIDCYAESSRDLVATNLLVDITLELF